MQNDNSSAIIALCSRLCMGEGVEPLEPAEWSSLSKKLIAAGRQPGALFDFSDDDFRLLFADGEIQRIKRLLDRSASLSFEVQKLRGMGIEIVTRADGGYPASLKKKLGQGCPPLFYCAGNTELLTHECIGFVGSRNASEEDLNFTELYAGKVLSAGFSVVSGGARGVDERASQTALERGGEAIEFLSDSMLRRIKKAPVVHAVREGRMLILSAAKPDAGFNVGLAMQRNRYIYCQAISVVVVKSDLEKGGTWSGATENLAGKWSKTYCWDNKNYKGNMALIRMGAIPLTADTDPSDMKKDLPQSATAKQQSIFD